MTTLTVLSNAVCRELSLLNNQTVLMQLAIRFTCENIYNCPGVRTDDLVYGIQNYLKCLYAGNETGLFDALHRNIYENLTQCTNEYVKMELKAEDFGGISPNINKIIRGKRGIPQYWIKEYQESGEKVERMAERLYWFLQYIGVYYGDYMVKNESAKENAAGLMDYYVMKEEKAKKANVVMRKYLISMFSHEWKYYDFEVDLWTVAVVIAESVAKQYKENQTDMENACDHGENILKLIKVRRSGKELSFARECNKANALMDAYFSREGNISFQDVVRQYQKALKIVS